MGKVGGKEWAFELRREEEEEETRWISLSVVEEVFFYLDSLCSSD